MPIQTLRESALRLCVANANSYTSMGDLAYSLVKPILQVCSATQLAALEDGSPHLREDTDELWQRHVAEKFRLSGCAKEEGETWRDVYDRLKEEHSKRLEKASQRLRDKNGKLKEEKMAKRIIVLNPKSTPVDRGAKRKGVFGGTRMRLERNNRVEKTSPKKNSLFEKAKRRTSITLSNYANAPKFNATPPLRKAGTQTSNVRGGPQKPRREPVPPNENTVFGRMNLRNPERNDI
jgi:RNA polymerase II transcription factor SIII (Elongin) subunit A